MVLIYRRKFNPVSLINSFTDKDDNGHIDGGKIMEKLAGYFDAIKSLKQFIEDKEFQHLVNFEL